MATEEGQSDLVSYPARSQGLVNMINNIFFSPFFYSFITQWEFAYVFTQPLRHVYNAIQGEIFSEVQPVWFQSLFFSLTVSFVKGKEPSRSKNLLIARRRRDGLMSLHRLKFEFGSLCLFSYDKNYYTKRTSV